MAYWWAIAFGSLMPVTFAVVIVRAVTGGLRDGFRS